MENMSHTVISKFLGVMLFLAAAIADAALSEYPFLSSIVTLSLAFFSGKILNVANTVISNTRFITGAVIVSLVLNVILGAGCFALWQQSCVMVPDLTGKTVTDAINELNSCRLAYNENSNADAIIVSHNPRAEIKVAQGTVVEFFFEENASEDSNLEDIPEPTLSEEIMNTRPGKTFLFGRYEQEDEKEGEEPIEWVVLAKEDDRMLVISKYGLHAQPYNLSGEKTFWNSSSIRNWLQDEFYEYAFSEDEKPHILLTENDVDHDTDAKSYQGYDSSDYVFLLSVTEFNEHIKNNSSVSPDDRYCEPVPNISDKVEKVNNPRYCWWWLRTTAMDGGNAYSINCDKTINYGNRNVSRPQGAVRPAMWISLN